MNTEFEILYTRRVLDPDRQEEIEDWAGHDGFSGEDEAHTYYGPTDRRRRIESHIPTRYPRSAFEAAAAMAIVEGLDGSAAHGIYVSREGDSEDENEEAEWRDAQKSVIDGLAIYQQAGATVFRGGKYTFDDIVTGVRSRGDAYGKAKKPPQPPPPAKPRNQYVCTTPGCGKEFMVKGKPLNTNDPTRPIRCETCRKANPIHRHKK